MRPVVAGCTLVVNQYPIDFVGVVKIVEIGKGRRAHRPNNFPQHRIGLIEVGSFVQRTYSRVEPVYPAKAEMVFWAMMDCAQC